MFLPPTAQAQPTASPWTRRSADNSPREVCRAASRLLPRFFRDEFLISGWGSGGSNRTHARPRDSCAEKPEGGIRDDFVSNQGRRRGRGLGILLCGRVRALKDSRHPSESSPSSSEPFPSPVYSETVLAVNFEDAKKYFLDALLEIHTAHTLMLARQAIIPKAVASVLLEAISKLDRVGILAARYDGHSEDLFFYVQHLLVESCGEDAAGRM